MPGFKDDYLARSAEQDGGDKKPLSLLEVMGVEFDLGTEESDGGDIATGGVPAVLLETVEARRAALIEAWAQAITRGQEPQN